MIRHRAGAFYMFKVYNKIMLLTVALILPITSALADSAVADKPADRSQYAADYQLSESGYIQHIHAKDVASLLGQLGSTYRECHDYRRELSVAIEEMQIDAGDIVITVILPGGLLYLGQKKLRLMSMEYDLDQIDKVLVDLEADVTRLSDDRQLAKAEEE